MKNNLEKLLEEINSYDELTYEDNVKIRLNKTLDNYISNLDETCERIKEQDKKLIIKELSK